MPVDEVRELQRCAHGTAGLAGPTRVLSFIMTIRPVTGGFFTEF